MKNYWGHAFLIFFLAMGNHALAQKKTKESLKEIPDTLFISNLSSTYLAFPQEVDLINIGSPDFVFQVEKSIIFLKAIRSGVKNTNMLIRCGNSLFTISLIFQIKPKKSLYDFRKMNFSYTSSEKNPSSPQNSNFTNSKDGNRIISNTKNKENLPASMDKTSEADSQEFNSKINKVLSYPDRFKTFGTSENQITILLTNIFTDSLRMYLKFKIINRSSLNYDLDYVSFQFQRNGHFTKNTVLTPIYSSLITSCGPHAKQNLIFVLPLFGTSKGGLFTAIFRELNGDRKETIEIPDRAFNMAGALN